MALFPNEQNFDLDKSEFPAQIETSASRELQGLNLKGGMGGGDTPNIRIMWVGRANHLDWQGNQRF